MAYDDHHTRAPQLTPFESELRATARPTEPWEQRKPGPWRRYRDWRRRRRPPQSLAAALALGVLRVGLTVAVGAVLAWIVAGWLDRETAIGFYLVGTALLVCGVAAFAGHREASVWEHADSGPVVHRARPGVGLVGCGLVLVVLGALVESF
jgi:hypothetical protein